MFRGDKDLDTICAVSTPSGVGGISVIRISGKNAFTVSFKLCPFITENPESHKVYYGIIKNLDNHEPIDEVLVSCFHQGRSFTGENVVEISCHGNPIIAQQILNALVLCGARLADRGEFTYRAFIQGRLDLVQAESVLEVIQSQSQKSATHALRQLQGGLSNHLETLEKELILLLAHLEASIDFSTEGIETISSQEIQNKTNYFKTQIFELVESYKKGRKLRDGFRISLVGLPNVGKSSLFNLVLQEDRAIVTNIAGTTRDLIDSSILISGVSVTLTDTAGLRESQDLVEQIGIKKSFEAQSDSDLILFVFDVSKPLSSDEILLISKIPSEKLLMVAHMSDKSTNPEADLTQNLQRLSNSTVPVIIGSSFQSSFRFELIEMIKKILKPHELDLNSVITQSRHFEKLNHCFACLDRAETLAKQNASSEFISLEIREALLDLQEVLGRVFDDQILDKIFKEFCIGK